MLFCKQVRLSCVINACLFTYLKKLSNLISIIVDVAVSQTVVDCVWIKFLRTLMYMPAVLRTLGSFVVLLTYLLKKLVMNKRASVPHRRNVCRCHYVIHIFVHM